jgi:hypothetical protein
MNEWNLYLKQGSSVRCWTDAPVINRGPGLNYKDLNII